MTSAFKKNTISFHLILPRALALSTTRLGRNWTLTISACLGSPATRVLPGFAIRDRTAEPMRGRPRSAARRVPRQRQRARFGRSMLGLYAVNRITVNSDSRASGRRPFADARRRRKGRPVGCPPVGKVVSRYRFRSLALPPPAGQQPACGERAARRRQDNSR